MPGFDEVKQVDAGVLSVGYVEAGQADGPAALLLHGWPYDIHAFGDVAPRVGAAGYRVLVPCLRGFGTTRFLEDAAIRNGEPHSSTDNAHTSGLCSGRPTARHRSGRPESEARRAIEAVLEDHRRSR